MIKRSKILIVLLYIVLGASCASSESSPKVQILSSDTGEELAVFQVEIADEPAEQARGLMYRQEMGKNQGMLFIFPSDRQGSFWMKNTLISLDIIFITADKKILNIVAEAEPQTTTPRSPEGYYRYVLEINGGLSETLGLAPGDQVVF